PLGGVLEDPQLRDLRGIDDRRGLALPPKPYHPGRPEYLEPLSLVDLRVVAAGAQRLLDPSLLVAALPCHDLHRQEHLYSLLGQVHLAALLHPVAHTERAPAPAPAPIGSPLRHCVTRSMTRKMEASAVTTRRALSKVSQLRWTSTSTTTTSPSSRVGSGGDPASTRSSGCS